MLVQYKPDLKEAKTIPFNTNLLDMEASTKPTVCGLLWLSNAQFLVSFTDAENENANTLVYIMNSVKSGPPILINYGEVCYESSQDRAKRYVSLKYQFSFCVTNITYSNHLCLINKFHFGCDSELGLRA